MEKKNQSALVLLLAGLFLTGCHAMGPKFSGFPQLKADKAQIVIYRPATGSGRAIKQEIFIDDTKRSGLANGGYVLFEVEPGVHKIKIEVDLFSKIGQGDFWMKPAEVALETQGGKIYYERCMIVNRGSSIIGNQIHPNTGYALESIPSDVGLTEVKDLRLCK